MREYKDSDWFSERVKHLPEDVRKTFPFLIVPKASSSERNEGLDGFEKKKISYMSTANGTSNTPSKGHERFESASQNVHPTVKPVKLMCYLVTLGSRTGDVVWDPFAGSGTTPIACELLNRRWVAAELNPEYCRIAEARLAPYLRQGKLC